MTVTINLPEEEAALLEEKASSQGTTLQDLLQQLATREATEVASERRKAAETAVARIREIRKDVKPDPEGWTVLDYIKMGRR